MQNKETQMHTVKNWAVCLRLCLSVWWVTVYRSCVWSWDCCCHLLVTVWCWHSLLLPVQGLWIPAAHFGPEHPEPQPAAGTPPAAAHSSANTTDCLVCKYWGQCPGCQKSVHRAQYVIDCIKKMDKATLAAMLCQFLAILKPYIKIVSESDCETERHCTLVLASIK